MSSRPRSFALLLATVALALAACGTGQDGVARPRNVLLISIDTLRADHLGCYGYERSTSPTLDALAKEGVRFDDVTAAAPWTLPSHATMLTGLYPNHHGVKGHETRLAQGVVTLAEEFQQSGFQTMAVVNSHNLGAPQFQLDQGFDKDDFRYVIEVEDEPRTMKLKTVDSAAEVVSTAEAMLRARAADEPFFLFLHFYDVHSDYAPRAQYRETFVGRYEGSLTGATIQLMNADRKGQRLSEDDLRFLRGMYDGEIRQLDDELATFFDWLRGEGLADETLFVVTSDHGEEFQEHGGLLHGKSQYREVLRVPLILAGPGIPSDVLVTTPAHGVDVTPTILAAMGLVSSQPRDGLDLAPNWRGGSFPTRSLFGEADHNNRVDDGLVQDIKKLVRQGSFELLLDVHTGAVELYDLSQDPLEQHDLAPAQPERVKALREELQRYLDGAVVPDPVPPEPEEVQLDKLIANPEADDQ